MFTDVVGFRSTAVLLALIAAFSPSPLGAQDTDTIPVFGGGHLLFANPVGEFEENVDFGFGLGAHVRLPVDDDGTLSLRLDLGFINYGNETIRICITQPCRVTGDLTISNNILLLGIGPERAVANLNQDILAMRPGVDSTATPLIFAEQFREADAAISRDGRWLAYSSDETGRHEIFVRPFPNVDDGKWQVSTEGGVQPVWAHNGRELFFLSLFGQLEVAEFTTADNSFLRGRVTPLFTAPQGSVVTWLQHGRFYDVSLDDQRFLMARPYQGDEQEGGGSSQVILVQNFFEELKAQVPN